MTLKTRIAVILAAVVYTSAGAATAPRPKTVAYIGGTLIDVKNGTVKKNAAVVTRGDRITAIMAASRFRAADGQDTVNIHGKFVIPGLVNTHVHLATLANPSLAKAYLRREVYSGVTTVRDMAGDARLLAELKREAEFDEIPSPDIFYVALMAGPEFFVDPRTHDAARGRVAGQVPWMQAITSLTDLPLAVAEARGTGATAIKIYGDLSASLVSNITEEAHRQHMLVWAHSAVFPALPNEVVDAGVDVISHACMLGFQLSNPPVATYESRASVDATKVLQPSPEMDALYSDIKQHGAILDATLYAFETNESRRCSAGVSDNLAKMAYQAGIPISAGTDDDADWNDPDSALDTELALLVHKVGMSPADALRSATLIGARAAGQEKAAGTIKAGKLANLVVLNKDPLQDIANVREVFMVVKHGIRYMHRDYKPMTNEESKRLTK